MNGGCDVDAYGGVTFHSGSLYDDMPENRENRVNVALRLARA